MTYDEYAALPYFTRQKYLDGEFRPNGRYGPRPPAKSRKR